MTVAVPTFEPGPLEARGLGRAVRWSFAVHVGLVVALFVIPREWLAKAPPSKPMTIVLGGTPGPRSTGTTSLGGRTVETVAPPPRRPEPVRPTPRAEPAPAAVRTPPAEPRPTVRPRPAPPAPARMPTAGTQVTQGTTRVDTGVVGQGTGLTFGRGGTGGETDLRNFCCPAYLELLLERVGENWMRNQPERGTATIRFTVHRDGTITGITVQQTSGFGVLDRASRSAVSGVRLPPLPAEYTFDRLTVNLQFPYGGS